MSIRRSRRWFFAACRPTLAAAGDAPGGGGGAAGRRPSRRGARGRRDAEPGTGGRFGQDRRLPSALRGRVSGVLLIGLAALPFVKQSMSLLAASPAEYSPAVLEQKAREIAAAAGYPAKPADSAAWMWTDAEMANWIREERTRQDANGENGSRATRRSFFLTGRVPATCCRLPTDQSNDTPAHGLPGMDRCFWTPAEGCGV